MRRLLLLLIILGAILGTATAARAQASVEVAPLTVITAANLFDGKQVTHNRAILIRGNKIVAVTGPDNADAKTATTRITLGPDVMVLPGLVESHTHIFLQGEDPVEGGYDGNLLFGGISYRAARATMALRRALDQGFTTIRDVETEGAGYGDVGLKRAVEKGYIPGPRIFASTRAISTSGGYPLEGYAPEIQPDLPKGAQLIDGPIEARKAAREQLDNGADWIKVYMTHRSWLDRDGNLFSQPTLTLEEINAIVDETHGWGKKVACHAYNGVGLQRALDAKCDSIEHGLELTDANVAQMLRQGTWYCPTLSVYYGGWAPENTPAGKRDRKRVAVHGPSFQKALKAGVKIVFGTDVGGFSWSDPIAQEFPRMVALGMSPLDALVSATSRPAEMLEMTGQIGTVAPGAYADVIAIAGDPTRDISVMKDVRFVMKDGKVWKNEAK
ncbi:MAG: amidohydrolase family protein [Acidobacteriota bacterium]|nr:amidohydrolase family protein [Acidobacteriota bacterium]